MSYLSNLKAGLLFICLTVLFYQNSTAQWAPTSGPEGGSLYEMAQINSTLFVSAVNGGVYKSNDNGVNWEPCSSGLPSSASVQDFVEFNGNLYASVYGNGIYLSSDLGENWQPINSGIENLTFYNIAVQGDEIYAGNANGGVYYSSDNGTTWTEKSSGVENEQIRAFAFLNSDVYAGGIKLYRTSEQEGSWEEVSVPDMGVNGLRSLYIANKVMYLSTSTYILVSKDSTKTWNKNTLGIATLNMHNNEDSVYMVSTNGHILSTKNDGTTWSFQFNSGINGSANDILALEDKIVVSTNENLYSSLDNGNSWTLSSSGIKAVNIQSFGRNSNYIFAGSGYNRGVFRSNDGGQTWENINQGLDKLNDMTVNTFLTIEDHVFIATGSALYKSINDGENWTLLFDPGVNKSVQAFDFDKGLMAIGINGDGVYISEDTAKTWTKASTDGLKTDTSYGALKIVGDSIMIGTAVGEVFLTKDKGVQWNEISPGGNVYNIDDIDFIDGSFFITSYNTVMKTNDLGDSWGFFVDGTTGNAFKEIYEANGKMYLAAGNGTYVATIGDSEWELKSEGWNTTNSTCLIADDTTIYAGTYANSIWSAPLAYVNNTVPEVTGTPSQLSTPEETPYTIQIDDLTIEDPDVVSFENYVIEVLPGDNYSVSGNEITPDLDFNGSLIIPVTVADEYETSEPFEINIEVTPVNDVPVITSSVTDHITFLATPITIELADLEVSDVDNTYPDGFSIRALEGDNYTVNEATVTPDEGFEGELSVQVVVNDGADDSEPYVVPIEVSVIAGFENSGLSNSFKLSPNPASDKLSIYSSQLFKQKSHLKVLDIRGNTIIKEDYLENGSTKQTLDISALPKGIYFLVIESGPEFGVSRFIKK